MKRREKTRFQPSLDALGDRCLPATAVTANLAGGVLVVQGSIANDTIDLQTEMVRVGRRWQNVVNIDGVGQFPLSTVRLLVVNGGEGDDAINIQLTGRRSVRLQVDGGSGNDTINIQSASRRPSPMTIQGGAGDDVINAPTIPAPRGRSPVQIDGGSGNDMINGVFDGPASPSPVGLLPSPTGGFSLALSDWQQQIIDLTNQQRLANGLAPLRVNDRLVSAAQIQANQMAQLDQMSHELPSAPYPSLVDRANHVGYHYARLGENIAYNYQGPVEVVTAWMNSPGHRANILDPQFTEIGVGLAQNLRGEFYYAQVFGTPL